MSYGGNPFGGRSYGGSDVEQIVTDDTQTHLSVEVAFTTGALETPVWEDITADVRFWSVHRGRTQELERFPAGTATVVLGNLSRQYDSVYADGPHFGNIRPNRRIRIRETFNSVTYPVFDGYVDRWDLDYPAVGKDATATVTATDAGKFLARTELPPSVYYDEVLADGPVAWWRLGDPATITTGLDQIGSRDLTFADNPRGGEALVTNDPNGSTFFDHAEEGSGNVAEATVTTPISSYPFTIETVFRSAKQSDTLARFLLTIAGNNDGGGDATRVLQLSLVATFDGELTLEITDDQFATGSSFGTFNLRLDDKRIHHAVIVCTASDDADIWIDGVQVADAGTFTAGVDLPSGTVQLALGNVTSNYPTAGEFGLDGELQDVAIYDYALSPTRIAVHADAREHPWQDDQPDDRLERILDEVGIPDELRELDAGNVALQSASFQ